MSVRAVIFDQVRLVAADNNKTLLPLTDDLLLLESGLDSLCIAILVANLEDKLRIDPFGSGDDVEIPTTFGDLVRLYESAKREASPEVGVAGPTASAN
jgi:acyl carrier protein